MLLVSQGQPKLTERMIQFVDEKEVEVPRVCLLGEFLLASFLLLLSLPPGAWGLGHETNQSRGNKVTDGFDGIYKYPGHLLP